MVFLVQQLALVAHPGFELPTPEWYSSACVSHIFKSTFAYLSWSPYFPCC